MTINEIENIQDRPTRLRELLAELPTVELVLLKLLLADLTKPIQKTGSRLAMVLEEINILCIEDECRRSCLAHDESNELERLLTLEAPEQS